MRDAGRLFAWLRALASLAGALICAAILATPAVADFPYLPSSGGDAHDPATYKLPAGEVPTNLHDDFKFAATPETPAAPPDPFGPLTAANNLKPSELCGVRGSSIADQNVIQPAPSCISGQPVSTAFQTTTGRPDVAIAVLDSGIEWNDAGAMTALRKKVRLNPGELPAPVVDRTNATTLDPSIHCDDLKAAHGGGSFTAPGGDYDRNGGTRKPDGSIDYDVLNQGVFDVLDYACDSRVHVTKAESPGRHGPDGTLTPEDLILAFSSGSYAGDHDNNGYANDIAGWNYVDNTNNAYDDVHYGHGTGEARDSNGEANTSNDLGSCPNCTVVPLRVGESFIADANRFAQAVLYATDNDVLVVQEALGTLNQSSLARQAIDYAYNHGTAVIASAADEAAEHHNQPGALPHTIVVNSARPYDPTFTATPRSYLQFNGCTNFSTKIVVSVESTSCSSEATGKSAGVAGLIYSAAMNAHDAHALAPSHDCKRVDGSACVITANEVRQLIGSGNIGTADAADIGASKPSDPNQKQAQADNVNFEGPPSKSCTPAPTPNCTDPNSFVFGPEQNGGAVGPLANSRRYPARKGFNEFYGYGRLNAYKAVRAAGAATIPPEAEITSPDWFQRIDPTQPTLQVDGHVGARSAYTCQVFVAPGGQPNNALTTDTPPGDFKAVPSAYCGDPAAPTAHAAGSFDGTLAALDLTDLKSRFPPTVGAFNQREPGLGAQTSQGRPNTMPYAFTIRVVVTQAAAGGKPVMTGEDRRQSFLHRDQDMLAGFPRDLGTDGASSPLFVDLTGSNRNDLVVGTSDGVIHAYRPDGSEVPGWPVHTDPLALHTGAAAFRGGGLSAAHYGAILGGLAAGDLFHDGRMEIVAGDNEGKIYAWDSAGRQVFRQEANPLYSGNPAVGSFERQGRRDRVEHGFFTAPVLADLEQSGSRRLDIVAAGEDRHLYAWRPDGSALPGFPVVMVDPRKVASIDPGTHHVNFAADAGEPMLQGKIVDTPAVANLGPDGKPAIVVGTNEEYKAGDGSEGPFNASAFLNSTSISLLEQAKVLSFANSRIYVVKRDGRILDGWPRPVGLITPQLLPDVGEGITGAPVVGEVACGSDPNVGPKVGVIPDAGPGYLFNQDGSSCFGSQPDGSGHQQDVALATDGSLGTGQFDHPAFPAVGNPAFGNIGPAGKPAFLAPAAGLMRAVDAAAPEYQPSQDFLAAWDPQTGQFQSGFPSPVNDLQFLTGPSVADIAGQPREQAIGGTASLDLQALNFAGAPASANWPKLTGDWTVAQPLVGSFGTNDTDPAAHKVVVSITRAGWLAVYSTPAPACSPSSWPRFHHDIANSGDLARDAVPPGKPYDLSLSGSTLNFTAPGGDLLCGSAGSYEAVQSDQPITPENFEQGDHIGLIGPDGLPLSPAAAGTGQRLLLPASPKHYVAIRAIGDQGKPDDGNIGQFAEISTTNGAAAGARGGGSSQAGGGVGAGARGGSGACSSPKTPTSRIRRAGVRLSARGITLRGISRVSRRGCRGHVTRVSVAVARISGRRCSFLNPNGRFGRPTSCARPRYLPVRGRTSWSFRSRTRLARGRYRVFVTASTDVGARERGFAHRNSISARVG
ncbi:MAG: hypothetical protein NVSMB25_07340 [Thermoleophilaceae bacterium]